MSLTMPLPEPEILAQRDPLIRDLQAIVKPGNVIHLPRELALSACFALPWLASAALFRWSARQARAG